MDSNWTDLGLGGNWGDMTQVRTVGLKSAVGLVIGNMIGVSIYVAVGFQVGAGHSGVTILALWALGALIAVMGALCYAELAAAFPGSGGEYHFLNQAYPPSVGFMSGWLAIIAGFPAPIAFGAVMMGNYFFLAMGVDPDANRLGVQAIAVGAIVVVTALHGMTLRSTSRSHGIYTLFKVLMLVVFVVGGLVAVPTSTPVEWVPRSVTWSWNEVAAFCTSLYWVLYAYSGWNAACYIGGEVNDARRSVPRALWLGIGIVFVLYFCMVLTFLRSTPAQTLLLAGDGAAMAAAQEIFGKGGGRVMGICICLGFLSFISSMVWAGPRVSQRMGQDYQFFSLLARTNRSGVPSTAIYLQSILAVAFVLVFDDPARLILYVEFLLQISVFLTVLSVIILRIKRPDLPRPILTWGYPITPILFLVWTAFAMGVFLHYRHKEALQGLVTLGAGLVTYFICKMDKRSR